MSQILSSTGDSVVRGGCQFPVGLRSSFFSLLPPKNKPTLTSQPWQTNQKHHGSGTLVTDHHRLASQQITRFTTSLHCC